MVCEVLDRFYYKIEGDDLLVSPADETPAEPGDARPDELDVAIALERVEEATGLGLRSIRTSWAGLRSFVPDRRPVVGSWPDHPGFGFVAGQGRVGHRDRARARRLRRRRADGRSAAPGRAPRTGRAGSYSPVGSRG
jgi:D-arginine dehydrogenase